MKVMFDHQLFSFQRYGGASKYFAHLLNAMPRGMWDTTTLFSNNEYVRDLKLFRPIHILPGLFFRGQGRIMHEMNIPFSIMKLRRGDYDVFHQTHFETYCLKPIGSKPMVTTFHDVNFSTANPNPRIVEMQIRSLRRADAIIAVSENTRRDLLATFDFVDPAKVTVIHHGMDKPVIRNAAPVFDFPYILYVGSRKAHKNFRNLQQAFIEFHRTFPDIRLVCTWRPFDAGEIDQLQRLGIADSVVHVSADEDTMNRLYRDALFYVFPSMSEGFGLPILEAWSNDCPVVLSRASCLPEIAGDAALYFNPDEPDDIAAKMIDMIQDESLRADITARGIERFRQFGWDRCAKAHIEIYKSLC